MAGNEETRSSLVEGLEHFSEEEQLKMALELSKHDTFGSSDDLGPVIQSSSTNMSVDSFQSAASGFEFDDWIRTPAEDRLQILTGTGGTTGEGNNANVIGSISVADKEVSVDNDEVDEDELLKKNIEEKAKVALGPSKLETASNNPIDMPEDKQLEAAIKLSLGAIHPTIQSPSLPCPPPGHGKQFKMPASPLVASSTSARPSQTSSSSLSEEQQLEMALKISQEEAESNTASQLSEKDQMQLAMSDEEYKVERIIDKDGYSEYLVKWKNYEDPEENTWEPLDNLADAEKAIKAFEAAIKLSLGATRPTIQSPSLPCPPTGHCKQFNIPASPLVAFSTNARPGHTSSSRLSEEQQLDMALKISQEEAESNKLSEEDQMQLAMRLSRSESVCRTTSQPVKRTEGSIEHSLVRSLLAPGPSHSYPSRSSQLNFYSDNSLASSSPTARQSCHGSPRVIVVDGSNVGMAMGKNQQFRGQALSIVYDWFSSKGHEVVIFLPRSRWNRASGEDRELLDRLEKGGILFFTPSRRTQTGSWDSYDDRYIVQYAAKHKGVIVTNDNYRDLIGENREFKDQIENRLLPFTFIKDEFFPPDDPMGKNGPRLTQFLKH